MAKAKDDIIVAINKPVPKGYVVTAVDPSTCIKTITPKAYCK